MNLNFKTLKIKNFMSFKDEEFDFSLNRGLTLVCGKNLDIPGSKNGAGKSSLFGSLLYVLFGELQYTIRNQNLRNRYVSDKEMSVELTFQADAGRYFKLTRGLNRSNSSFLILKELDSNGNVIKDLNRSSIAETDKFIQKEIIHCDISIFLRTIILSSDQNYNFFKLTPSAKRDFIEKLFNISTFGDMYQLIHKDLLKLDKEITAKQSSILILKGNHDNYSIKMQQYENEKTAKMTSLELEIEKAKEEYNSLLSLDISQDSEMLSSIKESIDKVNDAKIKIDTYLNSSMEKQKKLLYSKTKELATIEHNKKLIDGYSGLISKLCDHCTPIVNNYFKLDECKTNIDSLSANIIEDNKKLEKLNEGIETAKKKNQKLDEQKSSLINKIYAITSKSKENEKRINNALNNINNLTNSYNSLKDGTNPYLDLFESNQTELTSESELLTKMDEKYSYLSFAENIVAADTLKKFIVKDLVNLLNIKIRYYLAKLGGNFECNFDENMACEFQTPGGVCDYANFSSGEQMRLMIATCFAFKDFMQTRNNFHSNILILDEFIDSGIDTLAVNGVMQILADFVKMNKQSVYVISHRTGDLDNSQFDSIIQIVKEKNLTKVTYLPREK